MGRHRVSPWEARECDLWLFWGVFSRCHGVGSEAVVRISLESLGMCLVRPGTCLGDVFFGHLGACSRSVPSECVLGVSMRCPRGVLVCVLGASWSASVLVDSSGDASKRYLQRVFGMSWNVSLGCVLVFRKLSSGCVLRVSWSVSSGRVLRVSLQRP